MIILEAERTLEIFCDIYRAMYKFSASQVDKKLRKVYRTDRGVSVEELKKGITVSFTSTSLHNNPEAFLLHKSELTFLEILVPPSIPHLDFAAVLGEVGRKVEIKLKKICPIPEMWKRKGYLRR